jgi:hypothetical protein
LRLLLYKTRKKAPLYASTCHDRWDGLLRCLLACVRATCCPGPPAPLGRFRRRSNGLRVYRRADLQHRIRLRSGVKCHAQLPLKVCETGYCRRVGHQHRRTFPTLLVNLIFLPGDNSHNLLYSRCGSDNPTFSFRSSSSGVANFIIVRTYSQSTLRRTWIWLVVDLFLSVREGESMRFLSRLPSTRTRSPHPTQRPFGATDRP